MSNPVRILRIENKNPPTAKYTLSHTERKSILSIMINQINIAKNPSAAIVGSIIIMHDTFLSGR